MDDMAAASVHVMNIDQQLYRERTSPLLSHINVGYGSDVTIAELAETVAATIGYKGKIEFDTFKPDGAPKKLMDSRLLNEMGWRARRSLQEGLRLAYEDFLANSE